MIGHVLRKALHVSALAVFFSPMLLHASEDLETRFGPQALQARQTHAAVDVLTVGDGADRVYVFVPAQPALHGNVPMVLLHHGWQGMNPLNFGALIDHLAAAFAKADEPRRSPA